MKLREIILDFTSLLDVIMIILFWFIINYRAQAQEQIDQAQNQAAQAEQSASEAIADAQSQMEEAEALKQQANDELEALAEVNERQASYLEAIRDFRYGANVTLYLCMEEEGWRLDVYKGDLIGTIPDEKENRLSAELMTIFADAGYAPDATMLCVFTYDSSEPGTRSAYQTITRELKHVQLANSQFSYSEVDSSNQRR